MAEEEEETWRIPGRPPTPFIDENLEPKGWAELEHGGFRFYSRVRRAAHPDEREELAGKLGVAADALPSSVYPSSCLTIESKGGVTLGFDVESAVRAAFAGADSALVEEEQRQGGLARRFCTDYCCAVSVDRDRLSERMREERLIEAPDFASWIPTNERLPTEEVMQKGEILLSDKMELWEDSSSPNVSSRMEVKLRVMQGYFLVLVRCFAVEHGQRAFLSDTRLFARAGAQYLLQDTEVRQASLGELRELAAASRPFSASVAREAQDDARFLLSADTLFETVQPSEVRCRALQVDV